MNTDKAMVTDAMVRRASVATNIGFRDFHVPERVIRIALEAALTLERGEAEETPAPVQHTTGYRNENWKTDDAELESALDAFWNVAYTQGHEQRGHDDEAGTAQKAEDELRRVIASLAAPSPLHHVLPIGDNHPDSLAVDRFAVAMKAKLAKKRAEGRGGWEDKDDCSQLFLSQLLREHVEKGDPVDVGNLAMMLHQREERISSLLETLQGE